MKSHFLSVPAWELNLSLCVQSGQVFRWQAEGEGWIGIAGNHLLRVVPHGNRWQVASPTLENPLPLFLHLFRLEVDLKRVQCDPRWEHWVRALPGLRLMRWNNPEECLFSFVCTPANNIPRITGMIERLCEHYGEPIAEWSGKLWHAFPDSYTIARLREAELRALGFGYRARTLIQVAQALRERGEGWLASLAQLPYWEAKEELMHLPGVGAKIADCVLLFGLDNPYAVPVDTHMWQAVQEWLPNEVVPQGKSLTERAYRAVVEWFHERFGEWTGWAHQYLFTAHLFQRTWSTTGTGGTGESSI